jgi:4-amino-4-deoxy-L-arabinose transferase-like glycosyltransferase
VTDASTTGPAALPSVDVPLLVLARRRIRSVAAWAVLGGIVFLLLSTAVTTDPARGVTWSNAPFTDEAWNVVNARNLILVGTWSTDDWTRHPLTLPFSLAQAVTFAIGGVGIVQARLVCIVAVALTTGLLGWSLRRVLGPMPALVGAAAFAGSALVLYYGRLAFLEPMEALFLVAAAATIPWATGDRARQAGLIGGALLALAIGTKSNAVFATVGILGGMAVVGARSAGVRRWLAAAVAVIVAAGLAWLLLVWVPNRQTIGLMSDEWVRFITRPPYNPIDRIAGYLGFSDGAFGYLAPVSIGAAVALFATARAWRLLGLEARLLSMAGLGWVLCGWGILFVVTYNPNRYLVPVVPGFALIIAVGVHAVLRLVRGRPALTRAVLAAAVIGLVLPGAVLAAGWSWSGPATLPELQDRVHAIIPAGSVVEGDYAPTIAMRVPGVLLMTSLNMNPGDLYADRGVRWLVLEAGKEPSWVTSHPDAWAARELMLTAPWGSTTLELYRLPGT